MVTLQFTPMVCDVGLVSSDILSGGRVLWFVDGDNPSADGLYRVSIAIAEGSVDS